jgi:AcrR family transcriptional regulator
MDVNRRRTQEERSAATRAALVAAARPLFADEGFAAVGTEAIVRAAAVTRGALYHQFADKVELFAAVFEEVEREVVDRIVAAQAVPASPSPADALAAFDAGVATWLDACAEPGIGRIVLVDGPAVLGWARWREIGMRYAGGLIEAVVTLAAEGGPLAGLPVRPLTHVVVGALEEAALYIAGSPDPPAARAEMAEVLRRTFGTLFAPP